MTKYNKNNIFQKIPTYGYVTSIIFFIGQYSLYLLARQISLLLGTDSYAFIPKIAIIDDLIPIIPFFAIFYLLSYLVWISGPIAVSLTSKANFINYLVGLTLVYLIGFMFFIFMPTYMDRVSEGLLNFTNDGSPFSALLQLIYTNDGTEYAFNLLPSYHCSITLYCYLGIRKQPEIPKWYKNAIIVACILICLSTVFTKQHYIIDVFAGLIISIICYIIVCKINPGKKLTT